MKVSFLNCVNQFQMLNFKSAYSKNELSLPNAVDYEYVPIDTFFKKQNELEEAYRKALKETCFPNGKLNKVIKEFLDETKFDFRKADGTVEQKTIGEKLSEAVLRVLECEGDLFHGTYTNEIAKKIIKEGFNPECITRTKCGPGFYFTSSEGEARNYGSSVLKVHCAGKQAIMKKDYYEEIMHKSDVMAKLCDFLDLKSLNYSTGKIQGEITVGIINEYCRNYIADELGIDVSYASSGRTAAIVVHNLNAINNIKLG